MSVAGNFGILTENIVVFQWVDEQLGTIRMHVRNNMENKTTFKELVTNMNYRTAIYIIGGIYCFLREIYKIYQAQTIYSCNVI